MTWEQVALGEVAETALGKMLDKGKSRGHSHVPYLRNVNVQWGRIDTADLLTMELSEVDRERFMVREGDVLVCEGGEVGRCAIWNGKTGLLAYQKALHRIRPGERLDARFLRHALEYYAANGVLERYSTGSTIAHLPQQQLRRIPIPLPPLEEQHRIVAILEDHLSRLDAADTDLEAAVHRIDALQRRQRAAVFESIDVGAVPLLEHATIANGQTPKGLIESLSSERAADMVPFFKVGDMNSADGRWMAGARHFIDSSTRQSLGLHVRGAGTVLIPKRGGAIATNKKRILREPAAFDLNTMGLAPAPDLLPDYLWHWLQTIDLGKIADGSNVPQINGPQIKAMQLPVPDVSTQRLACSQLDEIDTQLERLVASCTAARHRSAALRRSLLSAAFSGRLTGSSAEMSEVAERIDA